MKTEHLKDLIIEYKSSYKIAKYLNVSNNTVLYWINKLELYEFYKNNSSRSQNNIWHDEKILREVVTKSFSLSDCLKNLGLVPRGRNFNTIKKYIDLYKIDITHFNSREKQTNVLINYIKSIKKDVKEHLKEGTNINSNSLKKRLYKEGILKPICVLCGQDENWKGKKMSLILDHINGINNDNRIENLRIVCPNCNATLDTFCGKNKRENSIKKIKCVVCLEETVSRKNKKCKNCSSKERRKVKRPDKETLKKMIDDFGYREVARRFNVSDNAIRRWINSPIT